ncbi:MAG: alpha/beta fold hydrolase [bacterium]
MREEFIPYGRERIRLSVFEAGRGKPSVVFIPGSGCYALLYAGFLEALAGEGFNAVGMDNVGHGASSGRRGDFRYGDVIGSVRAAAGFAEERYGAPVGVSGSSLGGILALYAAAELPVIKSAACHNVMDVKNPPLYGRRRRAARSLGRLMPFLSAALPNLRVPLQALFDWRLVFDDPKRLAELSKDELMVWSYTLATLNSLFVKNGDKPDVEDVRTPVMVLVSDGDRILTEEYCRSVFERLGGRKEFLSVRGAGHMLFIEHVPKVIGPVAEWFDETLRV